MKTFQNTIYHPILAAVYPVIALLATNIDETPLSSALRAILASLILMIVLWCFNSLLLKDKDKAAIQTSLILIIFYSYGHLNTYTVTSFRFFGLDLLSHRYLLPISLSLIAGVFWFFVNWSGDLGNLSRGLNLIGFLLLALPVINIISFQLTLLNSRKEALETPFTQEIVNPEDQTLPDIYLIILDMYPRQDYLLDVMNYDNSTFVQNLRDEGFYVADCTLSNYSITRFSLTTLLNLDYLDTLMPNISADDQERSLVDPLLQDSLVQQTLKNLGYKVVAFHTDFSSTSLKKADIYIENADYFSNITDEQAPIEPDSLQGLQTSLSDNTIASYFVSLDLTKFEWLLIQTSALRIIPDLYFRVVSPERPDREHLIQLRKYEFNSYMLDAFDAIPQEISSPKFVFFHLISPHPPIVFDKDGGFAPYDPNPSLDTNSFLDWPDNPHQSYYLSHYGGFTDQVTYINKRVIDSVQNILSSTAEEPIIIIQGDHGPPDFSRPLGYQENAVLAAYYFPKGGAEGLYSDISPVNLFRHVFNFYFDADYELLEDVAYSSDYEASPYDFEMVEEKAAHCKN